MFFFLSFVFTTAFTAAPMPASSPDDHAPIYPSLATDTRQLLQAGIDDFYKSNLALAEEKFDRVIAASPNEPQGHFFKAVVYFWRYTFGSRTSSAAEKFLEIADKVIAQFEEEAEDNPAKKELSFYIGGLYGYRGLVRASEKNLIGAFADINKSNRITKRLAKETDKFPDAYFGLGISHYMAGDIPPEGKWMASLMGFSGSKEEGIKELRIAFEKGLFVRNEAGYMLAGCYEKEKQYKESKEVLLLLLEPFPTNVVFLESLVRVEQKLGNAESAEKICTDIIALKNGDLSQSLAYAAFTRAQIRYDARKFDEAVKDYVLFISKSNPKTSAQDLIYDARFKAGDCYEELGDRETALKYYISVGQGSKFYAEAQARLKAPKIPATQTSGK